MHANLAEKEDRAGVYNLRIDCSYTLPGQPTVQKITEYVVARQPGLVRIRSESAAGTMVFCRNREYMFAAIKPGSAQYILGAYKSGTDYGAESSTNPFYRYVRDYEFVTRPLTQAVAGSFQDAVRAKLIVVGPVKRDGDGYQVGYTRTQPVGGGRPGLPVTGTLTFDPAGRLLRRVEDVGGGRAWKLKNVRTHNAKLADGSPFTDSQTDEQISDGVVTTTKYTLTPRPDPFPAEHEFYLSHYGLPEPIGGVAPVGPIPLWWWFAGAVGLAVLAVLCHRLAQHRKPNPSGG
jgi:hypothetical protein